MADKHGGGNIHLHLPKINKKDLVWVKAEHWPERFLGRIIEDNGLTVDVSVKMRVAKTELEWFFDED